MNTQNPMKQIKLEKITLNIGVGKDPNKLEKALKLLEKITEKKPVKTTTSKRIPAWNLRPGLEIGCKITLRKKKAEEVLKRLLSAKEHKLKESQFDEKGNLAFGLHEYIDIPGMKYEHEIGILGLEVSVTLERPGFRIKKRKIRKSHIGKNHRITKAEAIEFMQKNFNVKMGEEE